MKVSEMNNSELLEVLTDRLKPVCPFRYMTCHAIHRAEMALICPDGDLEDPDWDMLNQYVMALELVCCGDFYDLPESYLFITATPRQRAEAMVKMLGGGE